MVTGWIFDRLGEGVEFVMEHKWARRLALVLFCLIVLGYEITILKAQTESSVIPVTVITMASNRAVAEPPDAPIPAMESSSSSNMSFASTAAISQMGHKPAPTKKHRWLTAYNFSLFALPAGEIVDSLGTRDNMKHHKWLCGYDSLWGTSGYAISTQDQIPYTVADLKSICGVSPSGVQPNYMFDVTQTNSFVEGGWAARWKLTGNRNYAGVEAWNLGNDVAQALIAHYLHKKGGRMGKIGAAMNYWHGIAHLDLGIDNSLYVSHNRTPAEWAKNNPKGFTWTPPYWWGKK